MTIIHLHYPSSKGAVPQSALEFEGTLPDKGDVVHVSGVRHTVRAREFHIEHGHIHSIDLHLDEMTS